MPQLEISTYASQLFWISICFGLLYTFTSRISIPLIADVLEKRQLYIDGTLQRGIDCQLQADTLCAEFERILIETREQTHQMLVTSMHDIAVAMSGQKKERSEAILVQIQSSQDEIAKRKTQSVEEIKLAAEMITGEVIKKLTGMESDADQIRITIHQTLKSEVA